MKALSWRKVIGCHRFKRDARSSLFVANQEQRERVSSYFFLSPSSCFFSLSLSLSVVVISCPQAGHHSLSCDKHSGMAIKWWPEKEREGERESVVREGERNRKSEDKERDEKLKRHWLTLSLFLSLLSLLSDRKEVQKENERETEKEKGREWESVEWQSGARKRK